jgi:hypothetical protein
MRRRRGLKVNPDDGGVGIPNVCGDGVVLSSLWDEFDSERER